MKKRKVVFREEALEDLNAAVRFYRKIEDSLGDYCFSSLLADVEFLEFTAGIHVQHYGFYCLRATVSIQHLLRVHRELRHGDRHAGHAAGS